MGVLSYESDVLGSVLVDILNLFVLFRLYLVKLKMYILFMFKVGDEIEI